MQYLEICLTERRQLLPVLLMLPIIRAAQDAHHPLQKIKIGVLTDNIIKKNKFNKQNVL
jgi:hypothetical protein